jgi:hypothetical protein
MHIHVCNTHDAHAHMHMHTCIHTHAHMHVCTYMNHIHVTCVLHDVQHTFIYAQQHMICLRMCNVCSDTRVSNRVCARVTRSNQRHDAITHTHTFGALQRHTTSFHAICVFHAHVRNAHEKTRCTNVAYRETTLM